MGQLDSDAFESGWEGLGFDAVYVDYTLPGALGLDLEPVAYRGVAYCSTDSRFFPYLEEAFRARFFDTPIVRSMDEMPDLLWSLLLEEQVLSAMEEVAVPVSGIHKGIRQVKVVAVVVHDLDRCMKVLVLTVSHKSCWFDVTQPVRKDPPVPRRRGPGGFLDF